MTAPPRAAGPDAPGPAPAPRRPPLAGGRLPLLGHAVRLLRDPLRFLESLHDDGDVVRVALGPKDAYVVCSPELVHQLLVGNSDAEVGGSLWDKLEVILGQGVATSNGALHRRQRLQVQPSFRSQRIAEYARVMSEVADRTVASWHPGRELDLPREMFHATVRISVRTLMQHSGAERHAEEVVDAVDVLFRGIYRRMVMPVEALTKLPTPGNRRFEEARRALDRIVAEMVADRRADPGRTDDLLGALLAAEDEHGKPISARELRDQVVQILVAGTETSASTMAWTMYLLEGNRDAERRLQREVAETAPGRPVTFEDLHAMPQLRNVVTETLRMQPAGWIFSRRAARDIRLGDHLLPQGADVLYSPYALHRDPRHFDHPDRYDPDRWLPERSGTIPRYAMIPFGEGNRKCVGDAFGMTAASLMVAAIAARYRLRSTAASDPRPRPHVLMTPRRLRMRAEPLEETVSRKPEEPHPGPPEGGGAPTD